MPLKFYESPFHVTHDTDTASKIAMKMDLSIMITNLIIEKGWTQKEAALKLGISQSRISELKNAKIELFTIDAMFDMLDALGFIARMTMPSLHLASIAITEANAVDH